MEGNQEIECGNGSALNTLASRKDESSVEVATNAGSPERVTAGHTVTFDEGEEIPGPESAGLSTLDRLTNLQSFR
jgi:hypothetical protein